MHDNDVLRFGDERDEREIVDRVERELHQRGIGRVAGRVKQYRVAVGCCARGSFGCDRGIRATAVFDNHGLPEGFGQFLRECARDDVIGAAGDEADQETNRLVRIRLRHRERSLHSKRHQQYYAYHGYRCHGTSFGE